MGLPQGFSSRARRARRAALVLLSLAAAPAQAADPPDGIRVDREKKTVRLPAVVAKQGVYAELKGAIEYVVVSKGGKDYESLFVTDHPPEALEKALAEVGLERGSPATGEIAPKGPSLRLTVEQTDERPEAPETVRRLPVDGFILDARSGKPLEPGGWTYTGSRKAFDPEKDQEVLECALTKSLVGLHWTDASPLLQNPRPDAHTQNIYKANVERLPKEGTRVVLVFERILPKVAEGTIRLHLFIAGRVQGVGFRAFTQRSARRLGLVGWVKNIPDGRVEAVVEGPKPKVDEFLKELERGPRAARVEKIARKEEEPDGTLEGFEIRFEER